MINSQVLTDNYIMEQVNEGVSTNILAAIVIGVLMLIIFIISCSPALAGSPDETDRNNESRRKKRKFLPEIGIFLLIVGIPLLVHWNSCKKISDDNWHVEETTVTKKIERRDDDSDTHSVTYSYSIRVAGYSYAISGLTEGKFNSVSEGDEVYVIVHNKTGHIYDFYPMDRFTYEGEHLEN